MIGRSSTLLVLAASFASAACMLDTHSQRAGASQNPHVQRTPAPVSPERQAPLPDDPVIEPATGGPTVNVWPPHGARFIKGARFDIRVEGSGTGPEYGFQASLEIDGEPVAFSSGPGDPNTTDGISSPDWGGFNLRGYSSQRVGVHELNATFTSSQGTKRIKSYFVIEKLEQLTGAQRVKNVILLLGDGMGIGVRTAARVARFGVARGSTRGWLEMDRFPTTGMVTTHSLDNYVTDSSPGFSAYTTGTHNNNNQEGVFPARVISPFYQPRVETMAEYLHRTQGKLTGIVTTADVEDATPGAMAVHTGDRNAGTGICDQFLDESDAHASGSFGNGLAVLMGGGRRWFLPSSQLGSTRSPATDYGPLPADLVSAWSLPASAAGRPDPERDLLADFTSAGFTYVSDATSLALATAGEPPQKLLGLFHLAHMNVALDKIAHRRQAPVDGALEFANSFSPPKSPYAVVNDGFTDQPMLDEMAAAALKVLSRNEAGFVLLIEAASIDKQEHAHDADRAIADALEFDRAVGVAKRFAEADQQTLVLVLADHECAGFDPMGALRNPVTGSTSGSLDYLSSLPSDAAVVAPYVQPERQKVIGTNFNGAGFPKYEILPDGYPATFNVDGKILVGYGASADRYERWLTRPFPGPDGLGAWDQAGGMFLRGQAGITSGAAPHGAADVPVSAYAYEERVHRGFGGTHENIDVYFRVMEAVGAGR